MIGTSIECGDQVWDPLELSQWRDAGEMRACELCTRGEPAKTTQSRTCRRFQISRLHPFHARIAFAALSRKCRQLSTAIRSRWIALPDRLYSTM